METNNDFFPNSLFHYFWEKAWNNEFSSLFGPTTVFRISDAFSVKKKSRKSWQTIPWAVNSVNFIENKAIWSFIICSLICQRLIYSILEVFTSPIVWRIDLCRSVALLSRLVFLENFQNSFLVFLKFWKKKSILANSPECMAATWASVVLPRPGGPDKGF